MSTNQKYKKYKTLEDMLADYNIENIRSLVELSDDELDALINIIKLQDGKIDLSDLLKDVKNEEDKIKIFVNEIAKKLCRCIKKVGEGQKGQSLEEYRRIAICITSIFHHRGLTIPRLQCEPTPMLIPKKGTSSVIKKHKKV